MKKKLVSMLLVGGMFVTLLSGCGDTKGNEENASKEGNQANKEDSVDIRIFSSYNSADETEWSKFIVDELEKATNINLIRDEVPASAYKERLQLALSDGDYPDAFIFDSHADPLLLSAIDDGLIVPINEYLEKGDYPNLEKYIYEGAWKAAKSKNDENIYLIPRCTIANATGFAVRQDWMEAVGFEFSSDDRTVTKEEFLELMRKFTEEDPDGDGIDNTYGYAWIPYDGRLGLMCGGAFDCIGWEKSNGEYEYMSPMYELNSEKFKEWLEFNRELYKYTHPDSAVTTDTNALFYSGQAGMRDAFPGHVVTYRQGISEVNPDAKLTYLAGVVNDDGVFQLATSNPGIWGGIAITKNCKSPEKVLEMADWLLSDEGWEYALWGIPGVTYEKQEDGSNKIIDAELYTTMKAKGIWATNVVRRKEDTDFFLDLSLDEADRAELKGWLDTAVGGVVFEPTVGTQPEIATDTAFVEANNTLSETVTKIIMGTMDVEEYDSALQEWYEKGGKTYVEQVNEIIKRNQ